MKQHGTFSATRRLFDEDAYIKNFEADVIFCEALENGKFSVILDKTAFFPEGGGQPSDTGIFRLNGNEIKVSHVCEKENEICHITEAPVPLGKITGSVDFDLRYERMRNHSGEHLLSGTLHRMFGCTNIGFHLNDETVTVDLDKQLTKEQLLAAEKTVNDIIAENPRITAYYPDKAELRDLDYRSKLDLEENVRIVVIGEGENIYDRCACCAPHVSSAAEIGMLIITDSINYKGGTRLNMVCGKNAYKQARNSLSNVKEISGKLSAKASEAAQAFEKFMEKINEDKAKAASICAAYIELKIASLEPTEGNIVLFEPELEGNSLRRLVDKAADLCGGLCAGFSGSDEKGWNYIIISRNIDLKAISKELNEKMNARGGGSPKMLQGTAKAPRSVLEKIFEDQSAVH